MGKTVEEIAYELHDRLRGIPPAYTSDRINAIAAAIREDRAEPVSEAEVEAACVAVEPALFSPDLKSSHKAASPLSVDDARRYFREKMRQALSAARKARTE